MKFPDYTPSAPSNTMIFAPKPPSAWSTMPCKGVTLVNTTLGYTPKVDTAVTESPTAITQTFTNRSGNPLNFSTTLRILAGSGARITINGAPSSATSHDVPLGKVVISGPMSPGVNAVTTVTIATGYNANRDGSTVSSVLTANDFQCFLNAFALGCQ